MHAGAGGGSRGGRGTSRRLVRPVCGDGTAGHGLQEVNVGHGRGDGRLDGVLGLDEVGVARQRTARRGQSRELGRKG